MTRPKDKPIMSTREREKLDEAFQRKLDKTRARRSSQPDYEIGGGVDIETVVLPFDPTDLD